MLNSFRSTTSARGAKQVTGDDSAAEGPAHVAIIMDGNGRWATKRNLPRAAGHKRGAAALQNILKYCPDMGIKYLTVYAFSSENWRRPADEISDLMGLLSHYLTTELDNLCDNNIRLHIIGDKTKFSRELQDKILNAERRTAGFEGFHLCICLNYGARQEIISAARKIAYQVADGKIAREDIESKIDEELLHRQLYTHELPEPDLLIRTGGEKRLSNFLLWQSAYTELYFCDVLWPDFNVQELRKACECFASRQRRYGGR